MGAGGCGKAVIWEGGTFAKRRAKWDINLHVAGVAKVLSGLVGALVGSVLQVDDALTGTKLLLAEVALILLGGLGSDVGSLELGMEVAGTTNSHQALGDLWDISPLVEVDSLEHIDLGHAPGLARLLEPVDVLHLLELSTGRVDLGDAAGHQLVHKVAENNSILEDVLKRSVRQLLSDDVSHPREDIGLKLRVALASQFVGDRRA